jgi:hypothetical protein
MVSSTGPTTPLSLTSPTLAAHGTSYLTAVALLPRPAPTDDPPNAIVRGHFVIARILTRLMLWGLGVWHIRVDDKRVTREPPVMITPNHTTYIDGWVVYVLFTSMMLSKLDITSLPLFGTIVSRPSPSLAVPRTFMPTTQSVSLQLLAHRSSDAHVLLRKFYIP